MNEPMHPSTLGEILDRTANLYRSRFFVFLGISLLPFGVVLAVAFVVGLTAAWWSAAGAASMSKETGIVLLGVFFFAVALVAIPIFLGATALAMAAMSHAVSRVYLGESTTIRDAYKSIWRRGWRYIGLCLLQALFAGVAPLVVWVLLILIAALAATMAEKSGMGSAAIGTLFVLVMALVLACLAGYVIWMVIELSLAFPACVVEQIGAWASIKRSFLLTKGTRGRIFLLFLLGVALGWLLSMGIAVLLIILLFLIPGIGSAQHHQALGVATILVFYGAAFAVQALVRPVYGIALVLFYYDQRIRNEGFDIEWMMQQAGMVPAALATVQAPSPVPEVGEEPLPWLPAVPRLTPAPEHRPEPLQTGVDE